MPFGPIDFTPFAVVLTGTPGDDTLSGDVTDDSIDGGGGNDEISGGKGDDTLNGDDGHDTLFGDNGHDEISGGTGDDLAYGGYGNDRIDGGDDDDTLWGSLGRDRIVGGDGDDLLWGEEGRDKLLGGFGNDTLRGGVDDDKLVGDKGADILYGGEQSDTLYGGGGNDSLWGDADDDTLYGGNGNDTLIGGSGGDALDGGKGRDKLQGYDGEDTLIGGAGKDKLFGGDGNDTLYGGDGNDKLFAGDGDDALSGGLDDDFLRGEKGDDLVEGDGGLDRIYGDGGKDTLYGGDDADRLYGGSSGDLVQGDGGDDLLFGEGGSDSLYGGDGLDTLWGGNGADVVNGDAGNDTAHYVSADNTGGPDVYVGGDDTDTLVLYLSALEWADATVKSEIGLFADAVALGNLSPFAFTGFDLTAREFEAANLFVDGIEVTQLNGVARMGFSLSGATYGAYSGFSVSSAGDVDGDGIDDILVGAYRGAPEGKNTAGETFVVFGKDTAVDGAFEQTVDLGALDGSDGFVINGAAQYDYSGYSVSDAGDVNGDGIGDILIGAFNASASGRSYVVFGKDTATAGGFGASFDLASLNGINGFILDGIDNGDRAGHSVSSAGDVNGDGIDDIIIGAYQAGPGGAAQAGETYIVFGKETATAGDFAATVSLSALNGSDGFVLNGIDGYDQSGISVSSAGDVNGDGIDDMLVGAHWASLSTTSYVGETYVVFGKDTATSGAFAASIDLVDTLTGTNGFLISGVGYLDASGFSVAAAGDVNGDGIGDIVIGAPEAESGSNGESGETYVIFGKDTATAGDFAAEINLASLNGTNGFVLNGTDADDYSGYSVSSAGDVNGDGIDDILIGAYQGDPVSGGNAGETYLVFGKDTATDGNFAASIDLDSLDGTTGYVFGGVNGSDNSGLSVSMAGDVNGDGVDDILIGAYWASPHGVQNSGESYVIYGGSDGLSLYDQLDGTADGRVALGWLKVAPTLLNAVVAPGKFGFLLKGHDDDTAIGSSVATLGDVNGDGIDDIIVGAVQAAGYAGEAYIVFGRNTEADGAFDASTDMDALDGNNGFVLRGTFASDWLGRSVSSAGDVNGDGIDDILVGATGVLAQQGETYVVFGKDTATEGDFVALIDPGSLTGSNGFTLVGVDYTDYSGHSVASAGDINGDGIDDLLIGAYRATPDDGVSAAGESYVVFGKDTAVDGNFAASIDLGSLNGTNGFRLNGVVGNDYSGDSVSSAGDVNGDGIDDLLIGAYLADPTGAANGGKTYVVFGKDTATDGAFAAQINLETLNGGNGFVLNGIDGSDVSGRAVAAAGDLNGDGIDDIVIGAPWAEPGSDYSTGETYIVFGKDTATDGTFAAEIELDSLDGSTGFTFYGSGQSGTAVASAGDVNGDGIADLLIGAPYATASGDIITGQTYLIFGKDTATDGDFGASVSVSDLDGNMGYVFNGIDAGDDAGLAVSSAGDVNGDGLDDLMISSPDADANGHADAGEVYVVFGGAAALAEMDALDGAVDGAIELRLLEIAMFYEDGLF